MCLNRVCVSWLATCIVLFLHLLLVVGGVAEYGEFEKKLQHQRTLMAKPNSGTLRTSSKKSMHVR